MSQKLCEQNSAIYKEILDFKRDFEVLYRTAREKGFASDKKLFRDVFNKSKHISELIAAFRKEIDLNGLVEWRDHLLIRRDVLAIEALLGEIGENDYFSGKEKFSARMYIKNHRVACVLLEQLDITRIPQSLKSFAGLEELILNRIPIIDMEDAGELVNLRKLTIVRCGKIEKLKILGKLKNLKELFISGCVFNSHDPEQADAYKYYHKKLGEKFTWVD